MIGKVAVIGDGAWGLALASVIAENTESVLVYSRKYSNLHLHPVFSEANLAKNIIMTQDITVVNKVDALVIAIPAQQVRHFITNLKRESQNKIKTIPIIIASKGIENNTCMYMTQVIESIVGKCEALAVISGPNFASEVIHKNRSSSILALSNNFSQDNKEQAQALLALFNTPRFRVDISTDLIGTQLCGATKNIFAIGSGMLNGLGISDNTKAIFMTVSVNEMIKIVTAYGGKEDTVMSVAGIGDLFLTCTSMSSRNTRFGYKFIKEASLIQNSAFDFIETTEGLATLKSLHQMMNQDKLWSNHAGQATFAPICEAIYNILYDKADPLQLIENIFVAR